MLFFEDYDRDYEKKLWEMRFEQIAPIVEQILGKDEYKEFIKLYISEFMNPENFLYYSKFVFECTKV